LILTAVVTVLVLLPLSPFIHRFTYHVPTFLFLVFLGTLIYSLVAFPFSATNRYKAYFIQRVDLETGQNNVTLSGLEEYVRPIISTIPSSAGKNVECVSRDHLRSGVVYCSWPGLAPRAVDNVPEGVPPEKRYEEWLDYNVTRFSGRNAARFSVQGKNTRSCVIRFASPIKSFNVLGSSRDPRFDAVSEMGSSEIRLWHREWEQPWEVDVEWAVGEGKAEGDEGIEGHVVCMWSDGNVAGVIPALDEVRKYAPDWVAIAKASDGLVEGSKPFVI
jgi:hypothetical protein